MKPHLSFLILLMLASVLLLSACLTSVHPLYTQETLTFDNRLLGQWQEAHFITIQNGTTLKTDDEGFWRFQRMQPETGKPFYRLTHLGEGAGEGDTAYFDVHLLRLGNQLFVDFYPEEVPLRNSLAAMMLFPGHVFAKVSFEENLVRMHLFNGDWLVDLIQENRIRISHEDTEDHTLLTAPTEELQKFVLKYAGEEKAYGNEIILSR